MPKFEVSDEWQAKQTQKRLWEAEARIKHLENVTIVMVDMLTNFFPARITTRLTRAAKALGIHIGPGCHLCGAATAEPGCPLCPGCAEEQQERERDARDEAKRGRPR